MFEWFSQFWQELLARPSGPFALRFYLQPLMATIFAVRDGLNDARHDRPAYFWAVFTNSGQRKELLHHGWKSISKIFIIAIVLDCIYQLVVLHALHPLQALVIATTLAIVPYVAFRGPVNRLVRHTPPSVHESKEGPRKTA